MDKLGDLLAPLGVDSFGVCAYEDCLPLLPCRAQSRVPANPRSVIVALFPYYTGPLPRHNVARYAVLPDYHRVAGGILDSFVEKLREAHPGEEFVPFVDNSPLREVSAAVRCGLGAAGWHGQLISPRYGGWVMIGAVITSLTLTVSAPGVGNCMECGLCRAACPTGALGSDGALCKDLCRSHITQKKGELTPWERRQIAQGGLVWGCDLCLEACPMNKEVPTPIRAFYNNPDPMLTPENLSRLMEEKSYGYRGKAVLQRNYDIIVNQL